MEMPELKAVTCVPFPTEMINGHCFRNIVVSAKTPRCVQNLLLEFKHHESGKWIPIGTIKSPDSDFGESVYFLEDLGFSEVQTDTLRVTCKEDFAEMKVEVRVFIHGPDVKTKVESQETQNQNVGSQMVTYKANKARNVAPKLKPRVGYSYRRFEYRDRGDRKSTKRNAWRKEIKITVKEYNER